MTFCDILLNIAISIIASLTIWCFLQLYSVGARKKINRLLMIVRDECIAFEKYLKYNDYDNALQMTRRILDKICEVFDTIKCHIISSPSIIFLTSSLQIGGT